MRHLRSITEIGTRALATELIRRPFLPASALWDQRPVIGEFEAWCTAMLADTLADCSHYSTYFNQECIQALWDVKGNLNCTIGMYRRLFSVFIRSGRKIQFSDSGNDIFSMPAQSIGMQIYGESS
ncbi:hypothetical protein [Azospirillum agricola]|uniref:hypothetical protein n=1 Tax=Azospirillum agricola TaxID=1720247 RepID=UPI0011779AE8|nr:hypothetical protein [Azospirillum agricola]